MNATATTARPTPTARDLRTEFEAELDRLLAPAAEPARPTVATSPLCLCWPDETDE